MVFLCTTQPRGYPGELVFLPAAWVLWVFWVFWAGDMLIVVGGGVPKKVVG